MTSEKFSVPLKFIDWQPLYETEKPFQIFTDIPPDAVDQRTTNLVFEDVQVDLTDVRCSDRNFTLDNNGFRYLKHTTNVSNFTDKNIVENEYLPEIEQLLRSEITGVDRVFFFDWRIRKNAPEVEGEVMNMNDRTTWLRPALHVHVDQSPAAALHRIRMQLAEDSKQLLRGRVRIINSWRPLIDSVEDWPLAACDGATVNSRDLIECDHVRKHYMGSTMYLRYNHNQRFYYMSRQGKNDLLLFKQFDSDREVSGKFAPHASFKHPVSSPDCLPRQSIEVRALVFTYPKDLSN